MFYNYYDFTRFDRFSQGRCWGHRGAVLVTVSDGKPRFWIPQVYNSLEEWKKPLFVPLGEDGEAEADEFTKNSVRVPLIRKLWIMNSLYMLSRPVALGDPPIWAEIGCVNASELWQNEVTKSALQNGYPLQDMLLEVSSLKQELRLTLLVLPYVVDPETCCMKLGC